ncbi:MAG: hypothetical protein AAFQ51_15015 [Pseudomonadota bacterium]
MSTEPGQIDTIVDAATRVSAPALRARRGTERVSVTQIPLLFASPDGQSYMLSTGPKALVSAVPANACPVRTAVQASGGGASAAAAITSALTICHERLEAAGLEAECGCQLLAHDSFLRAPLTAFDYATDQPARLFTNGRLDPLTYLSQEIVLGPGQRGVRVSALSEPVIDVVYTGPETVSARFPEGEIEDGTRRTTGFSRGRLVEAVTVPTPDGDTLRVILGP